MSKWIYAGSFDPVTKGHLDIIERAVKINDDVVVAVLVNNEKTPLFSLEERIDMLEQCTQKMVGVTIKSFSGLLMSFAESQNAKALVRGLRTISDFDYEFRMAALNKRQNGEIETIFIMAGTEYSYISSSAVKEIGLLGGDISQMVPEIVLNKIETKLKGDLK